MDGITLSPKLANIYKNNINAHIAKFFTCIPMWHLGLPFTTIHSMCSGHVIRFSSSSFWKLSSPVTFSLNFAIFCLSVIFSSALIYRFMTRTEVQQIQTIHSELYIIHFVNSDVVSVIKKSCYQHKCSHDITRNIEIYNNMYLVLSMYRVLLKMSTELLYA